MAISVIECIESSTYPSPRLQIGGCLVFEGVWREVFVLLTCSGTINKYQLTITAKYQVLNHSANNKHVNGQSTKQDQHPNELMRIVCLGFIVVVVVLLAFLGFSRNEDIEPYIPGFVGKDKLLHFLGFFTLTIGVYFVWNKKTWKESALWTLPVMTTLCILSECVQGLLPVSWISVNI